MLINVWCFFFFYIFSTIFDSTSCREILTQRIVKNLTQRIVNCIDVDSTNCQKFDVIINVWFNELSKNFDTTNCRKLTQRIVNRIVRKMISIQLTVEQFEKNNTTNCQ